MSAPKQPYRPSYGQGAQPPAPRPATAPTEYQQQYAAPQYQQSQYEQRPPEQPLYQQPEHSPVQQFAPQPPQQFAAPSASGQDPRDGDEPGAALKAWSYLVGGLGTIVGFVWRAVLDRDPQWVAFVAIVLLFVAVAMYFAGYVVSKSRK